MVSSSQAKRIFEVFFIAVLVLGMAAFGCKKKEEPNVTYDSHSGSDASGGKGKVGESDLAEGGSKAGKEGASIPGMQTVYFEYDSSTLTGSTRKGIEANAQKLKSDKTLSITIEGHCDERGSTQYNLALGERRANAVREYLVNLGISKSRLKTISYGEEKPAVVGNDESAWSKNRRAEFTAR